MEELFTLVAIIAIFIVIIIGMIRIVRKISAFYTQRFQFSIWSGVLLFILAISFILIIGSTEVRTQTMYILGILSLLLAAITVYNDIRLAGIGWGLLAVCIQVLFSFFFIFFILFAIIGFFMRKVFKIRNSMLNSIFGVNFGWSNELSLLLQFLRL